MPPPSLTELTWKVGLKLIYSSTYYVQALECNLEDLVFCLPVSPPVSTRLRPSAVRSVST